MENKKLPSIRCPECGEEITRKDLLYCQTGDKISDIVLSKTGEVMEYVETDFIVCDGGEFFHNSCGGETISSDEENILGITR